MLKINPINVFGSFFRFSTFPNKLRLFTIVYSRNLAANAYRAHTRTHLEVREERNVWMRERVNSSHQKHTITVNMKIMNVNE